MTQKIINKKMLALALILALILCPAASAATVGGYSEGLALTEEGGLWGYANVQGKIVVPLQYKSAQSFVLGTALVESATGLGLIRPDGAYLIQPEYDSLISVGYGLYIAQKGDLWGLLSIVPFPTKQGGQTQELYPVTYASVTQSQTSGLNILVLSQGGVQTVVPVSDLPGQLVAQGVPSAQFPLIQGRLPSFKDVGPRDWHALWVDLAYNVGLMEGKGNNSFDPGGTLTVAEALKLAAFMESRSTGDNFHTQPASGQPWYRAAVAYCVASSIVKDGEFSDYERPITRAEMARIFAATTLGRGMPTINDLNQVKRSLPDVPANAYACDAIYALYAKGVFTGTDGAMTFHPSAQLTRAEAAAIVSRMARTEQRIVLW